MTKTDAESLRWLVCGNPDPHPAHAWNASAIRYAGLFSGFPKTEGIKVLVHCQGVK